MLMVSIPLCITLVSSGPWKKQQSFSEEAEHEEVKNNHLGPDWTKYQYGHTAEERNWLQNEK